MTLTKNLTKQLLIDYINNLKLAVKDKNLFFIQEVELSEIDKDLLINFYQFKIKVRHRICRSTQEIIYTIYDSTLGNIAIENNFQTSNPLNENIFPELINIYRATDNQEDIPVSNIYILGQKQTVNNLKICTKVILAPNYKKALEEEGLQIFIYHRDENFLSLYPNIANKIIHLLTSFNLYKYNKIYCLNDLEYKSGNPDIEFNLDKFIKEDYKILPYLNPSPFNTEDNRQYCIKKNIL